MSEGNSGGEHNRVVETIFNRSSTKKFSDTPIPRNQVELLLAAADRAPDHGLIGPWRFTVLEGESRRLLGAAMAAALLEKLPDADAEAAEREASKAMRSPVLIVVSASTKSHPKVPEIEQWVAVGAAIQNLWITAESLGLGAAWKTGSHAYSPKVLGSLGLSSGEKIIGFIHIGVPLTKALVRAPSIADKTRWL